MRKIFQLAAGALLLTAPLLAQTMPGGGGGGGSATTPGGSTTQVQYNNAGAFGGISGATTNGTVLTLTSAVFITPALGTPASGVLTNATGLPLTTGVTGTLPAANGGTGNASYTIGDLLYASGTTTLSKLAGVATTNVLLSGGVGTAPSWGKVANAAMSNSAITICGTSTSLGGAMTATSCLDSLGSTQGSILYRNASAWVPLTPGTNGQVLTSAGAAANPTWTTVSGSGTVTTLTSGSGILFSSGATCTTTCTISTTVDRNAQTGTTYATLTTDGGKIVTLNNGSAVAVSLSQANTAGFVSGFGVEYYNIGAGAVTVTAATSTFGNGLTTLVLATGQYAFVGSDSTNYPITAVTMPVIATNRLLGNSSGTSNYPTAQTIGTGVFTALAVNTGSTGAFVVQNGALGTPSSGTLTGATGLPISTGVSGLGTGVATALAVNASAAGGVAVVVASGTSALGTSAISSGTCATVVTTSATGTATTDVIMAGFNGDPTGTTGYAPSTSGMLTIIPYPSTNNVNFKVCNNTGSSITPGAVTLNWRVAR